MIRLQRLQVFFLLPRRGAVWEPYPLEELGVRSRGEPRNSWRLAGVVAGARGRGLLEVSPARFLGESWKGHEEEVIVQLWYSARSGWEFGTLFVVDDRGDAKPAERQTGERGPVLRAYRTCHDPESILWHIVDVIGDQETWGVMSTFVLEVLGEDLPVRARGLPSAGSSSTPRYPTPRTPIELLEPGSIAHWAVHWLFSASRLPARDRPSLYPRILDCLLLYEALRLDGGVWLSGSRPQRIRVGGMLPKSFARKLLTRTTVPANRALAQTLTRVCPLGELLLLGLREPQVAR